MLQLLLRARSSRICEVPCHRGHKLCAEVAAPAVRHEELGAANGGGGHGGEGHVAAPVGRCGGLDNPLHHICCGVAVRDLEGNGERAEQLDKLRSGRTSCRWIFVL